MWTGIAEIVLGLWLAIASLPLDMQLQQSQPALGLLLLTIAVTPANIYMFTHGAKLPINGPEVRIRSPNIFMRKLSVFNITN